MREETLTMIMRREKDSKITLWLEDKDNIWNENHIGYLGNFRIFDNITESEDGYIDDYIECNKFILNIKPDYLLDMEDKLRINVDINEYEIEESKEQKFVEDYGMMPVYSKKNLVRKTSKGYNVKISEDSKVNDLNINKLDGYYYIDGNIRFDVDRVGKTVLDYTYKYDEDGKQICTCGCSSYTGLTYKE